MLTMPTSRWGDFQTWIDPRQDLDVVNAACVALRSCGNDPRNDVRQDCRIFGTNVLGKDIYRCAANLDIGTDLGKTGQFAGQVTRQKARHEKESQLQAMMTQLFPDVENEA